MSETTYTFNMDALTIADLAALIHAAQQNNAMGMLPYVEKTRPGVSALPMREWPLAIKAFASAFQQYMEDVSNADVIRLLRSALEGDGAV